MDDITLTFWYTTQYLYSFFVSFHQKTFFAAQEGVFPTRTFVRIIFLRSTVCDAKSSNRYFLCNPYE